VGPSEAQKKPSHNRASVSALGPPIPHFAAGELALIVILARAFLSSVKFSVIFLLLVTGEKISGARAFRARLWEKSRHFFQNRRIQFFSNFRALFADFRVTRSRRTFAGVFLSEAFLFTRHFT
jgi:hypothetical protein